MSEDDEFLKMKSLELLAKSRNEQKSLTVLEVLLTDLSFDPDGPITDACKAIDEWGDRMDAVIAEYIDHNSISCFVDLAVQNTRAIEMSRIARERHGRLAPAINWVRAEWGRKASEYRNKKDFARTYTTLVVEVFPEVKKSHSELFQRSSLRGCKQKKTGLLANRIF